MRVLWFSRTSRETRIVGIRNSFDNTDGHMGLSEISKTPIPKVKGQYTLKK